MSTTISKRRVIAGLKRAKKRLAGKWCQDYKFRKTTGEPIITPRKGCQCCIYGALEIVSPEDEDGGLYEAMADSIEAAIPSNFRAGSHRIVIYNDAPRRTEKQVLALFDRAIKRLESQ